MNGEWESIALEYRKELELLHKDIETALDELEKKMPRSFEKGLNVLNHSLAISQENLYLTKIRECPILNDTKPLKLLKPLKPIKPINKDIVGDCFEGLL